MPSHAPARRRRNPDPPQTLREYLQARDAEKTFAIFEDAGIDLERNADGSGARYFSFELPDWYGYIYVFVGSTFPVIEIDAKAHPNPARLVDFTTIAKALSEQTGRIVTLSLRRPPKSYDDMLADGFVFSEAWYGDKFVYVPGYFPERFATGVAYGKPRPSPTRMRPAWKEYLPHDVGVDRVPRQYRTKVKRLVLDALAHDDLDRYIQARELAELVAE